MMVFAHLLIHSAEVLPQGFQGSESGVKIQISSSPRPQHPKTMIVGGFSGTVDSLPRSIYTKDRFENRITAF